MGWGGGGTGDPGLGDWGRGEVIGRQKQGNEGSLGSESRSLGRGEINVEKDQVSGGGIPGLRDEVIVKEMGNFEQSAATPHGWGLGRGQGNREGRVKG